MSSLLRTILILSFKGRFFSGMENHVFLPIITEFCLPSTEEVVVILWKYLYSFLSGGQGRSPFLPMPMFWDTATMQFSGRTMIAAENTSELACHTDNGDYLPAWREFFRAVIFILILCPGAPLIQLCLSEKWRRVPSPVGGPGLG